MKKEPNKTAYNKSLDLLSRQDYSKSKLIKKLLSSGYDSDEIELTITKLTNLKIINEAEYARKRIVSFIQKGQGLALIHMNLEKEELQVTENFVQEVYESLKIDTHQQIQELIEKKCRYTSISSVTDQEEIYKIKQKLLRHLTSKGHDFDLSHQLTQEYISSAQHNDPS